jgi:hypothetical protein
MDPSCGADRLDTRAPEILDCRSAAEVSFLGNYNLIILLVKILVALIAGATLTLVTIASSAQK